MNHVSNTKPNVQAIINKQKIADHHLNHNRTSRTDPELAHYRRVLENVALADVEVTKLPLVRLQTSNDTHYVVLGEIAQLPGRMVLLNLTTGAVELNYSANQLVLVSPVDLAD